MALSITVSPYIVPVLVALPIGVIGSEIGARLKLPIWQGFLAGVSIVGLAGYCQFWLIFASPALWWVMPTLLMVGAIAAGVGVVRRRSMADIELLEPLLGFTLCSIVLLIAILGRGYPGGDALFRFAATRWTDPLPGDNEMPYKLASQMWAGHIVRPYFYGGGWQSSDRPPLQTGLYMLFAAPNSSILSYQAFSSAFQMLCVPAVWALARSVGASRLWASLAMVAAAMMPITIMNGTFVWPKGLAAGLVCGVAALLMGRDPQRGLWPMLLASVLAGLSVLTHGTSVFALIGIGVAWLAFRRFGSWKATLTAASIVLTLYAPWVAYQKFFDPPGDRLLKWHLAGKIDVDNRPLMVVAAEQFAKLTPKQWVDGRVRNLSVIVDPHIQSFKDLVKGSVSRKDFRNVAFAWISLGLGFYWFALYALPAFALLRSTRALVVSVAGTFFFWSILIFEPGNTLTHVGSQFPQFALVAMCARLFSMGRVGEIGGVVFMVAHITAMTILFLA